MRKLFLFICIYFVSQWCLAQSVLDKSVSFFVQDEPLASALIILSEVSEVGISFSNSIIPPDKRVSADIVEQPLKLVLESFIKGTPIEYKLLNNQIVLFVKQGNEVYTISGFIEDSENGERLIGANVYTADYEHGTTSNEYGFFSLTLPAGPTTLNFSYLGYKLLSTQINLEENKKLKVNLTPSLTLKEVLVISTEASNAVQMEAKMNFSRERLPVEKIKGLPRLGGEVDLLRVAQLYPGVTSGADGVGGLHVRGGNADQNLLLLDGVPVYNGLHALGIFSIFNTNAVKSAKLIKGGFPARYGGRLSAVMDVRTREGNYYHYAGEFGLSLISSDLSFEGPIKKGKSSFFFSGRRAFTDFLLRPITKYSKGQKNEEGFTSYYFYDLNGKFNFNIDQKDKIYFSFYTGGDSFHDESDFEQNASFFSIKELDEQEFNWGNSIAALRWNHLFNGKLFANTTFTFSKFQYKSKDFFQSSISVDGIAPQEVFSLTQYNSSIYDIAAKIDFDYLPADKQSLKFGAAAIRHRFQPGLLILDEDYNLLGTQQEINVNDTLANSPKALAREYSLYLEDQIEFNRFFSAELGVYAALWDTPGKQYFSLQPRITARLAMSSNYFLTSSFTTMTQHLHLLTNSGIGLPIDLWMPSTAQIKPQKSWQAVTSFSYISDHLFQVSLEAYYKQMDNLITFQERPTAVSLDARNWENEVAIGQGKSYGIEFSIKKQKGNTTGFLSYTYSKAERQFDEINNGEVYPFKYDRTHDFKIALAQKFSKNIELSGNWVFSTGSALTLPASQYEYESPFLNDNIPIYNYGKRNNFRLPNYHRLDLGINFYTF
ncbi:MAG TPA: TonB-dependent receptor, partial [Saprospiraceae bacterium]|nr:TonB-dependent receptor [Saprospiraceae bacterium]